MINKFSDFTYNIIYIILYLFISESYDFYSVVLKELCPCLIFFLILRKIMYVSIYFNT